MLRITDKAFKYTSALDTDLKKRFDKIIKEQRAAAARKMAQTLTGTVVAIRTPHFA